MALCHSSQLIMQNRLLKNFFCILLGNILEKGKRGFKNNVAYQISNHNQSYIPILCIFIKSVHWGLFPSKHAQNCTFRLYDGADFQTF